MSRKLTYTCDRCKRSLDKGEPTHTFDFGIGSDSSGDVKRFLIDLCQKCWEETLSFIGVETTCSDAKVVCREKTDGDSRGPSGTAKAVGD